MKSGISGGEELRFGEFRLDLRQSLLFRGDEEVKLRPKAFDALKLFATNQGRLVTKTEMLEALWPGMTAVSEDSLAHCVMEVRRALGDTKQTLLKTVTGRGYVFLVADTVADTVADRVPETVAEDVAAGGASETRSPRKWEWQPLAWTGLALGLAGALWAGWTQWDLRQRLALVPEVERLSTNGEYAKAFDLAQRVLSAKPDEPRLQRLINEFSDDLTVRTEPAGAEVSLHVFGEGQERKLGLTPLERVRIPRGDHVLRIRNAGYAPLERSLTSSVERSRPILATPWDLVVDWRLIPEREIAAEMVQVREAKRDTTRALRAIAENTSRIPPFRIDRYEVSNADFAEFVNSGEFRKQSEGKDRSGLPGPRHWSGGKPDEELLKHPVTGVDWREARSYCRWRGKDLPTLYQWQAAARPTYYTPFGTIYPWGLFQASEVARRANLQGRGTWPVGSEAFGMSYVGAYDMAGNVREWLLNEWAPGRAIGGGSWRDDVYQFLMQGSAEETRTADDLGFRCAVGEDKTGAGRIAFAEAPAIPRAPDEGRFREIAARYEYPASDLEGKVVAVKEGPTWRREEVRFRAANGEMTYGYLYLPKNAQPPYQAIELLGGTGYFLGLSLTESVEGRQTKMEPFITAGRALFLVGLQGFKDRAPVGEISRTPMGTQRYRDLLRDWTQDLRRGMDYLASRKDIDPKRVVFWNNSTTDVGLVAAALEKRFAAVVICGAGFEENALRLAEDANPAAFAPWIKAPKLLLHGKYDELNPIDTIGRPVFDTLRGEKKWVVYNGGHVAPAEVAVPVVLPWLDEKLGPVKAASSATPANGRGSSGSR